MTRGVLVSHKLPTLRSGNAELDRWVEQYLQAHVSQVFDQLAYLLDDNPEFIAPTLLNSWVNFDAPTHSIVGYYKDPFGRVHLRGMVKDGTDTDGTALFALPSEYTPSVHHPFVALANDGSGYIPIRVDVRSTGDVLIEGAAGAAWLSLNGISFVPE